MSRLARMGEHRKRVGAGHDRKRGHERSRNREAGRVWLFGLHTVRDALENPARRRHRLIVTPNARGKLEAAIAASGMEADIADPRRFPAPLDPQSVHQGAALEAEPLRWGQLEDICAPEAKQKNPGAHSSASRADSGRPRTNPDNPKGQAQLSALAVALDRVTDPHNVGAILRSAEAFGVCAVIAPARHSAPETGALAKAASGALERQPFLRVRNLAESLETLKGMGYRIIGLDGGADMELRKALASECGRPNNKENGNLGPVCIVLGAEGTGLRQKTRATCDQLARIAPARGPGSLNVSNAAAVALYAFRALETWG